MAIKRHTEYPNRGDLPSLIEEYARLSNQLREISRQPDQQGREAATALFEETVRSTELITTFPSEAFRKFVTTKPRLPILIAPGDPPERYTQAEAQIAKIFRESVPFASRRTRVKRDEYYELAVAAWNLVLSSGHLMGVVPDRRNWSSLTRQIRQEILREVVDDETCEKLAAEMRTSDRPISKKKDRVKELVLRRMRAMIPLKTASAKSEG